MDHPLDDDTLRAFLAETLPVEEMARVERQIRDSSELRARLEAIRQNRHDPSLHTLGAIWRRARLTCPSRQQLGSYLLDALDPNLAAFVTFHLDVIECPYCQANLADLNGKLDRGAGAPQSRRARIYQSSRHLLGQDS